MGSSEGWRSPARPSRLSFVLSWSLLALGSGCITQRSIAFGQMAAPVGTGGADLSVSTGVMWQTQSNPTVSSTDTAGNPTTQQTVSQGLSVPWFEANAQYGFSRQVALNVHASPAGIQPGVKWTLNRSATAHIALLPEVGIGFMSTSSSNFIADTTGARQEYNPGSDTIFLFQGGLKVLVSHHSGFYGGVGYDFIYTRNLDSKTAGTPNTAIQTRTLLTSTQHQIGVAVGFSAKVGMISIRPEVAVAIVPAIDGGQNQAVGTGTMVTQVNASGGFAFAILPSIAFALTTPAHEVSEVEERPTTDPDEREGRDEEEEENARKRKRRSEEDD